MRKGAFWLENCSQDASKLDEKFWSTVATLEGGVSSRGPSDDALLGALDVCKGIELREIDEDGCIERVLPGVHHSRQRV
jgi:hypothetical protein